MRFSEGLAARIAQTPCRTRDEYSRLNSIPRMRLAVDLGPCQLTAMPRLLIRQIRDPAGCAVWLPALPTFECQCLGKRKSTNRQLPII